MLNKFIYTSLRVTAIMKLYNEYKDRYKVMMQERADCKFLRTFNQQETTWLNLLRVCKLLSQNDFKSYSVVKGKQITFITPYKNIIEFLDHFDLMIIASKQDMYSEIRFKELIPHRVSLTDFLVDDDVTIVNIHKTKERISQRITKLTNHLNELTDSFVINYQNRNLTNILHATRLLLEALLRARAINDESSKQKTGEKN